MKDYKGELEDTTKNDNSNLIHNIGKCSKNIHNI